MLEDIDDVSSESGSSSDESEGLDQYLQECYYNSYLHYEQVARQSNHVVDVYTNYNPNNLWQSVYLHNQQIEQLMSLGNFANMFGGSYSNPVNNLYPPQNQSWAPIYQ